MKIFHLSDLHIGLKLFNRDLSEDQEAIFRQIADLAGREKPDVILVAGDIYDKAVPSAEAVSLFDRFISLLTDAAPEAEIMMISGNHDSAARINIFRSVLSRHHIHMIGLPPQRPEDHIEQITLQDAFGLVHFYLLPFVRPSMVRPVVATEDETQSLSYDEALHRLIAREKINTAERNVLVSHQFYLPVGKNPDEIERMDSEIVTVGNIDAIRADVLAPFDYAALGHIHKPMRVGSDFYRYCGTPLACSVSESGQQKGVILIEMKEKGRITTQVLPLHPLHSVRVIRGTLEDVLQQGCEDFVSVVLTDKKDLDVIDMQDRLRSAFPRLLEIRRETVRSADYRASLSPAERMKPYDLCTAFLPDLDAEEQQLLRQIINDVQEAQT
ncbi:MAG: exonuclease SbcCD subunit D [Bilifractor sp.]|jgi:exonuclease SbcD